MRRHTIIIMYISLALLTGCSGQATGWQTGNVTLVRTIGVDRLQSGVRLSAFAEQVLTADGASMAESMQVLCAAGDSFIHLGHADQLLLGEEFARDGTERLMDYLARDRQIGPGARLWVARGDSARQMMSVGGDVSDRLVRLAEERSGFTSKLDCTATRLMGVMARRGSVAVPALESREGQLVADGYAVLRRGRLVGFLDDEQALGTELLCGQGAEQLVDVLLADGTQVVLSVRRGSITCQPVVSDGSLRGLRLRYTVQLDTVQGAALTAERRHQVARQAEVILCSRMAAALACAQLWDADFAGIEVLARAACSEAEWQNTDWGMDFRTLTLQVASCAQIRWPADMVEEYGNE